MANKVTLESLDKKLDQFIDLSKRRFDKLDTKSENHDKRFDKVDTKLVTHDKRFDKVDTKLVTHDKRFDKADIRASKLIKLYFDLDKRLKYVEENMVTKKDHDNLINTLDKFMKQVDTYYKEMFFLKNKVDRLEKWIQIIAKKVDVTLDQ